MMTEKQKLRSLENKMERMQKKYPDINFEDGCKNFFKIKEYFEIKQEHFHLKFTLEHCSECGQRYKTSYCS